MMSIVENLKVISPSTNKNIVIHTEHGDVHVNENFSIERDAIPALKDFVKVIDRSDNRVFWFNMYSIVWIGPR